MPYPHSQLPPSKPSLCETDLYTCMCPYGTCSALCMFLVYISDSTGKYHSLSCPLPASSLPCPVLPPFSPPLHLPPPPFLSPFNSHCVSKPIHAAVLLSRVVLHGVWPSRYLSPPPGWRCRSSSPVTFLFPFRDPSGVGGHPRITTRREGAGSLMPASVFRPPAVPLPLYLRDAHQHLVLPAFLMFATLKSQVGEASFPLHFSAYQ